MSQPQNNESRIKQAVRRLYGTLWVILLVSVAHAGINALFFARWGSQAPPLVQGWKVPAEVVLAQQQYYQYQLGQASAATLWQEADPTNRRYGLVLGTSSVRTNIEPEMFKRSVGTDTEWIVTGYVGPSMIPMNRYVSHLAKFPEFKPETVVLGIHPFMLKGYDSWGPGAGVTNMKHFPFNWTYANHNYFDAFFIRYLAEFRYRIFDVLGVAKMSVMHRPRPSPWEPQQGNLIEDYDADDWEREKREGAVTWAITEDGYTEEARELAELVECIETIREAWKVPVFVVLMPQAPYMNKDMPVQAHDVIAAKLQERFGGQVPLLDLRSRYEEADFFDPAHLHKNAKTRFSADLGGLIRGTEADRPGMLTE